MPDEINTQPAKKTATQELASKAWGEFKDGTKALFGPVASLVTARTLWTAAIIAGLGFALGWTDIRVFGLSALWAVVGASKFAAGGTVNTAGTFGAGGGGGASAGAGGAGLIEIEFIGTN